jgi:hypothetical protein
MDEGERKTLVVRKKKAKFERHKTRLAQNKISEGEADPVRNSELPELSELPEGGISPAIRPHGKRSRGMGILVQSS